MKFKTLIKIDVVILLIGIVLLLIGLLCDINDDGNIIGFNKDTIQNVLISVGCSIIASSLISFIMAIYLNDDKEARRLIDKWGLKSIEVRSILNFSINLKLESMSDGMDIMAFGMKNFLAAKGDLLESKIKNGCSVRILTMNPNSKFLARREVEENEPQEQIRQSIIDMVNWAKIVNNRDNKGSITVRFYDGLPQDMYQRVDKYVYVGPLLFGTPSQQTIAYEYKPGSRGAEYYTRYFLRLWNDKTYCIAAF